MQIVPLDPAAYQRHAIHLEGRAWAETNCYSDVIIELLHGFGHEPVAALAFTLAIDFEGDQWTFFKFPHADLLDLYGFEIQELAVWRPLADHIAEMIAARRPVLVELDSYFLPDTVGSAYRLKHTKSTVAVNAIDNAGRRLGYFHNQGYCSLEAQDFVDILQLDGLVHERMLPPYFEYVKIHPQLAAPTRAARLERSLAALRRQLALAPRDNPFLRFQARFAADLEWLIGADIEMFHAYSFATLRQFGACYELSETYLRWLGSEGVKGLEDVADHFQRISHAAKTYQFNLARSVARRRALDLNPLADMAQSWEAGIFLLRSRFG